jgi:hypothetical protein
VDRGRIGQGRLDRTMRKMPKLDYSLLLHRCGHLDPLKKSNLLLGWFRSTIPRLVQIWDGRAGYQEKVLRQRLVACLGPDGGENFGAVQALFL